MQEEPLFKNLSELNLALRVAHIVEDAVNETIGIPASTLVLAEIEKGRSKKVYSGVDLSKIYQVLGRSKSMGALKGVGLAALLYALYAGGKRAGHKIREWLGRDPEKRGNLPDPYEHLDEPYKYKENNKPDRSRQVSPGYYEPTQSTEKWYQDMEQNKKESRGRKTGIPADFGAAKGFSVGSRPLNQPNQFEETLKMRRKESKKQSDFQRTAQAAGSFSAESIDPIIGGDNLNSDIAGWVNPVRWEQFLSQGAGQYAAAPSPDSAFFDPSGKLSGNKPMEFRPTAYGKDFATYDPIEIKKRRLEQFNTLEPERQAAKSIWRMRQINLLEQHGMIDAETAAKNRELIALAQQTLNPLLGDTVDQLIQENMGGEMFRIPNQEYTQTPLPSQSIDWNKRTNPIDNPLYKGIMDKALNAMNEYEESPLYQDINQMSRTLSPVANTKKK